LTVEQYRVWLDQNVNQLTVEKEVEGIIYSLRYFPPEYYTVLTYKNDSVHDAGLESKYSVKHNFLLSIYLKESSNYIIKEFFSSTSDQMEAQNYLDFKVKGDFEISNSCSSSHCVMAHHERNYGLKPCVSINLSFNKITDTNCEDLTFHFSDNVFKKGDINIQLSKDFFKRIPKLK